MSDLAGETPITITRSSNCSEARSPLLCLTGELLEPCLWECLNINRDKKEDPPQFQVRLVCKKLRDLSWRLFGEHFRNLAALLFYTESFTIFEEIAAHPILETYVRHITICGQVKTEEEEDRPTTTGLCTTLTNVIQKFSNLTNIEVDGNSFSLDVKTPQINEFLFGQASGVVRCGRSKVGAFQEETDDTDIFMNVGVYDIAMEAFTRARLDKKEVKIALHFPATSDHSNAASFRLDSDHWKACSSSVTTLSFVLGTPLDWHWSLLTSTPNLDSVILDANVETFDPARLGNMRPTPWSHLRFLCLVEVALEPYSFVEFLDHYEGLKGLMLNGMKIHSGTWKMIFSRIIQLPELTNLRLYNLYQEPNNENVIKDKNRELWLTSREAIANHLRGVINNFVVMQSRVEDHGVVYFEEEKVGRSGLD